ncbi:hypothetical protein CSUI_003730 [Cystoisospora suis]|uniref:DNA/RNA-binding protein Alba-like domain-containing protein n=1 Tax=Cystoisospora suis TaxID=483139 RepID=A0A2C6L4H2_9APIC|nr:hypothetical protein CSUI_003730 [Cystoisospora suis]
MARSSTQGTEELTSVRSCSPSPPVASSPVVSASSPSLGASTNINTSGLPVTRPPADRIDLKGYRRVSKKKQEAADDTDVIVSSSGSVRLYIAYALRMLTGGAEPVDGQKTSGEDADKGTSVTPGGEDREASTRFGSMEGQLSETGKESSAAKPSTPQQPVDRITVRGKGQAMANAILTAEGVRGKLPYLHLIVRTVVEEIQDEWILEDATSDAEGVSADHENTHEDAEENWKPKCLLVPRTVYQIIIVIARHVTPEETQDKGYQPPLAPTESGQLVNNERNLIGAGFRRSRAGRGAARNSDVGYPPPGRGRGGRTGGRRSKLGGREDQVEKQVSDVPQEDIRADGQPQVKREAASA